MIWVWALHSKRLASKRKNKNVILNMPFTKKN